ncbi:hypothetical protein D3C73_1226040 [compost metagenome]
MVQHLDAARQKIDLDLDGDCRIGVQKMGADPLKRRRRIVEHRFADDGLLQAAGQLGIGHHPAAFLPHAAFAAA